MAAGGYVIDSSLGGCMIDSWQGGCVIDSWHGGCVIDSWQGGCVEGPRAEYSLPGPSIHPLSHIKSKLS